MNRLSTCPIGWLLSCLLGCVLVNVAFAQSPTWDKYFEQEVSRLEAATQTDLASVTKENWEEKKAQWRSELLQMLGMDPLPEKSELQTTVTGSSDHDGLTIKRLHYQSRPGLYVTANLYLPAEAAPEQGWPAVLYVCGHAHVEDAGRLLGNKIGYQHHGLWFARHGVACLMIDTVQLGELHGEHHGTYKLGRWDWISRGYTPAGVEAWNAIRGIDLLENWPGIDGARIGITGRSGGGAYSWYTAAIDERIKVAVPVAGITNLRNHVVDDCVEGHCDCMYMINYFGWDYPKLAALIAPRPLLLANSDSDSIFPLDGVMQTHRELAKLYAALGASQNYGVLITPGPHKDTQELQVGAFRWLLRTLKNQETVVSDAAVKEMEPDELVVFQHETPADERVAAVGSWFVPSAETVTDEQQAASLFTDRWLAELSQTALKLPIAALDDDPPFETTTLRKSDTATEGGAIKLHQAFLPDGLSLTILEIEPDANSSHGESDANHANDALVHLGIAEQVGNDEADWMGFADSPPIAKLASAQPAATHYFVRTRGAEWQQLEPSLKEKTHIIRRFYLLGQMPEQRQLADVLICLRRIGRLGQQAEPTGARLTLVAENRMAAIATLAGLMCQAKINPELPQIAELQLKNYPNDPELAPALPGILRVCDYASLLAAARGSFNVTIDPKDDAIEVAGPIEVADRLLDSSTEPQQANGFKIVEVDQHSAQVWVRATRWVLPNLGDLPAVRFESSNANSKTSTGPVLPATGTDGLQYAVPGVPAEVRVGQKSVGQPWTFSSWTPVDASSDFSALIRLDSLLAGEAYEVRTEVRAIGSQSLSSSLNGKFKTLPALDSLTDFRLAVGTCQAFPDRDGPHGFDLYRTMGKRHTDAFIMAGDVVYYDALARSVALADYHWQRTYSLPTLVDFHRQVPTYFLKDDHDTYVDDSWPGQRKAWTEDFTFQDGQRIFLRQTGLPTPAYRSFHIGHDLQIWLMEGRDFRSPNDATDGPEKSIWGTEQKAWLQKTLDDSTAKFKVIVSPTPLVGPDRDNKRDNHSNRVFQTEGTEIRQLLASYPNTVSVCGDRHWQYHSIDPVSGLHEFSVGPASDRHAGGWKQSDYRDGVHQFLRVAGGYLEIELTGEAEARTLTLRLLDTSGNEQHQHVLR